MWIFVGVALAFVVWLVFRLSIISLYAILFVGIVMGIIPYIAGRVRNRE